MPSREHERLKLTSPLGGHLMGDLWFNDTPGTMAVLFVHGFGSVRFGSKAEALAAACERRGWTFATFDLRGHGESTGTLSDLRAGGLQDDLDQIQAALAIRGVSSLFVVGSSMGGWATCWFALRHPDRVVACALIAPAFRFLMGIWDGLEDDVRQDWRETGRLAVFNEGRKKLEELSFDLLADADRFGAANLAERWTTPALIFHGLHDEVIPYQHAVEFLEKVKPTIPVELRLLHPGDHRLVEYKDQMAEAICAFFERYKRSINE